MVPPVICLNDCDCIGTAYPYYDEIFYLDCINYREFNGGYYTATKLLKYYTEHCFHGVCTIGNYDSYKIVAQFKSDDLVVG